MYGTLCFARYALHIMNDIYACLARFVLHFKGSTVCMFGTLCFSHSMFSTLCMFGILCLARYVLHFMGDIKLCMAHYVSHGMLCT